jgi:hypothetical protein
MTLTRMVRASEGEVHLHRSDEESMNAIRPARVAVVRAAMIAILGCIVAASCSLNQHAVLVQGDGSTIGCEVVLDGEPRGKMVESAGTMPDIYAEPPVAEDPATGGGPVRLKSGPGYAESTFRASQGYHVIGVVSGNGETLKVRMHVGEGALVRVSFHSGVIQGLEGS